MPNRELFNGIAVLIDDEFGDEGAEISSIAEAIVEAGGHVVGMKSLPDEQQIKNFRGASFFIVDWALYKTLEVDEHGVAAQIKYPKDFVREEALKTREFLKKLRSYRFAPVFVFTNENVEIVEDALARDAALYVKDQPSHIFVKQKAVVMAAGVFNVLTEWVDRTPSALALKRWEEEYESAKNKLFEEFHSKSVYWPAVLWQTFKEDGVPPSPELGRIISRNLLSRMTPFGLDMESFLPEVEQIRTKDEEGYRKVLNDVLEGERFIKDSGLHADSIAPGDVFRDGSSYYINIRPDCDVVIRDAVTDPDLYLLKGDKVTKAKLPGLMQVQYGLVSERDNECVIYEMTGGVTISFKFKELKVVPWSSIRQKRIGRLISPFLTRLQQRYAAYLQRPGLPRIPKAAMPAAVGEIPAIQTVTPRAKIQMRKKEQVLAKFGAASRRIGRSP
ncbi:UNVERIFIED_ORG: hypothetical protein J2W38_005342 [Variovorax paradoxus]|nr:hypothetical protein [Variovorax paradoxus]